MKILFSDYDGTIKNFDINPNIFEKLNFKKNIKVINNFMGENKFVITTGRSYDSIIKEVNKYDINYDYLTAYNGRVTFDKNNRLLYAKYIDKNNLLLLKNVLANPDLVKRVTIFNESGITKSLDGVVYIGINPKNFSRLKKILLEYENLDTSFYRIFNTIYISSNFNKSMGVLELVNNQNYDVEKNNIITVGDGKNDLELLRDYDGYKMLLSHPVLYKEIKKTTTSVHRLIKKE